MLDKIDLVIEPGMKVGILGASGAGKSTLLALAPRLYDLHEGGGAVFFDGRDVRGYRLADLRRAVTLVPQQAALFEGTILSNLTYARPNAGMDVVRRALEAADLAGLVEGLPLGLETPVGERGFTLSGGQRQRLALARALIAEPAVMLLDDCTSALDAETEARVQAALDEYLPERSSPDRLAPGFIREPCRLDRRPGPGAHPRAGQSGGASIPGRPVRRSTASAE